MENAPALTIEEQGTALLRQFARSEGKSFRQLGMVDERRMQTVHRHELTMSTMVASNPRLAYLVTGSWQGDVAG